MELNRLMFREYDIRGIWNEDITEEISYHIGRAYATKLLSFGKNKMIVGYDNRLSSPIIEENLVKGLTEGGVNVVRLGLVTTPMYYYAWDKLNIHAGIMITASHNPKEYNGFKMSYNGIHNMFGKDVSDLYYVIINGIYSEGNGTIEYADIKEDYVKMIHNHIDMGNNKLKVVYDCGIAFDGDGDRVGVVDNQGNMIPIDKFMIIIWRDIYNKVTKKEGFFDVKCSKALKDELIKLGVKPVETRTGNSYTKKISVENDYPFGGEMSGHLYFRDKFIGNDDGIYAGLRLVEILSKTNKKCTELLDNIPVYYSTDENKVPVEDAIKDKIVSRVEEYAKEKGYNYLTIDGVKVLYDDGFALVRKSNTTPNITTRYEAKTKERLEEITNEYNSLLDKLKEEE